MTIPNRPALPPFIALCGHPLSGKSLVQTILQENYGVCPIDDGAPLRSFAMTYFGLTLEQVTTQAGKLEEVFVAGRTWQVRKLLGELGNALEATFGKNVLPHLAIQQANSLREREQATNVAWPEAFSFGSVRRDQGRVYKDAGGIVIEIANPSAKSSGNEFDTFDRSVVDYFIDNDALYQGYDTVTARKDLEHKVFMILKRHERKMNEAPAETLVEAA